MSTPGPGEVDGHRGPAGPDHPNPDLTDGREPYDWKPGYVEIGAKRRIRLECIYVGLLMVACPALIVLTWKGGFADLLNLSDANARTFDIYAYAWLSGTLGGTVFVTKWLYHSLAKGTWHVDRSVWRVYTPHLSGAFSFGVVALANSGIIDLLNPEALRRPAAAVGAGFIFGYFSDYCAARLADVARHLLGDPSSRSQKEAPENKNQ